jgi:hypothetical protein
MSIERVGTYRVLCGSCGSSYRVVKGEDDAYPSCYVCGANLIHENVLSVEWGNEPVDHAVRIMQKASQRKEISDVPKNETV